MRVPVCKGMSVEPRGNVDIAKDSRITSRVETMLLDPDLVTTRALDLPGNESHAVILFHLHPQTRSIMSMQARIRPAHIGAVTPDSTEHPIRSGIEPTLLQFMGKVHSIIPDFVHMKHVMQSGIAKTCIKDRSGTHLRAWMAPVMDRIVSAAMSSLIGKEWHTFDDLRRSIDYPMVKQLGLDHCHYRL